MCLFEKLILIDFLKAFLNLFKDKTKIKQITQGNVKVVFIIVDFFGICIFDII